MQLSFVFFANGVKMGTYTTNKNLFMPSVGETGWGTLVNGNFETIDNFLKPITVSGSTYTFTGNHVGNQSGGSISATSITNSGTLTSTGKITANGGIGTTTLTASSTSTFTGKITANGGIGTKALTATTGTFSGAVTGTSFNGVVIKSSGTCTVTPTSTLRGYIEQSESNSILLLPPRPGILYSGSIKAKNVGTSSTLTLSISAFDPVNGEDIGSPRAGSGEDTTLTFTNFPFLKIWKGNNNAPGKYYDFKIT